jgi:hypothetical protein
MSKVGDYLRSMAYGRPSDPTPSNQPYEPSNNAGWVMAIGSLISAIASCNCAWPPTDAKTPPIIERTEGAQAPFSSTQIAERLP